MQPTFVNPDEANQRDQVGRFLDLLAVAAAGGTLVEAGAFLVSGDLRVLGATLLLGAFTGWLAAFPRRALAYGRVEAVVGQVLVATTVTIVGSALLVPFTAFADSVALLIPVAVALPYVETRALKQLMLLAWVAIIVASGAFLLPTDIVVPPVAEASVRLIGVALAFGLVLYLLYQSSARLRASGREFERLFSLSADLAEATDPQILGELIARHLAAATGFDECVIYALAPDTDRLAPFGSYPVERSLEVAPEALDERPMLRRVMEDQVRVIVSLADAHADPNERARLIGHGGGVMLLLPLLTRTKAVGVAELTAREPRVVDERRLALARTLAFEATMAIENGRLYQQLRHRALHDPLTGLANRSLFHDRVDHALTRLRRRTGARVAVVYLDLDDFKAVNDTLGHARGDRLLVLVAGRHGRPPRWR